MNPILEKIEQSYLKKDIPAFRVGDLVRVDLKIIEGESERVQAFEGVVIRKRGHGIATTFTVRKTSFGVGVERTLPLHSPRIDGIKVIRSGRVRRAKLYYLRDLSGKAARIQEQGAEAAAPAAKAAEPAPAKKAASPQPVPAR